MSESTRRSKALSGRLWAFLERNPDVKQYFGFMLKVVFFSGVLTGILGYALFDYASSSPSPL